MDSVTAEKFGSLAVVSNKKCLKLCITLLILNVAFIWGNSLLPAEYSRAFSGFVRNVLAMFLPVSGSGDGAEGHHILRKLAHFTEFACLGLLLTCLVHMYFSRWQCWALPVLSGVLVAAVDETIQFFIPGRGSRISDVGIDALGVILGIVLINVYTSIKQQIWRKIK